MYSVLSDTVLQIGSLRSNLCTAVWFVWSIIYSIWLHYTSGRVNLQQSNKKIFLLLLICSF